MKRRKSRKYSKRRRRSRNGSARDPLGMYASRGGRPRGWWMPKKIKGYMAIKRGPKLLTLALAMKK